MNAPDAGQLLQDYARNGSDRAFHELVARYIHLVHSVALRRVGGDAHQAEDVTQMVFTDLARKARTLPANVMLGGWLHRHTCFVCSSLMRGERRRQLREREAVEMNLLQNSSDTPWQQLSPVLDEAIDELDAGDREAVILRYFEQHDLRSVGLALGISEDAAQKRVSRAVDKLRELLGSGGVALTAVGLGTMLTANTVSAAPAELAAKVSSAAITAAASTGMTVALLKLLAAAKIKLAFVAAVVAIVATSMWYGSRVAHADRTDKSDVATVMAATTTNRRESQPEAPQLDQTSSRLSASDQTPLESGLLKLILVGAKSGKPVPLVDIDCRQWNGEKSKGSKLQANRFGVCEVRFNTNTTTSLELTTQTDGFADTQLVWHTDRGEKIPPEYTLRLVQAVPIGGKVVDADGNPVEGAKVGWNHETDIETDTRTENHNFGWIEVRTDAKGRWRINRIASEMIRRLYGSASHPEHVPTGLVSTGRDREAEKLLLAEQHVFQLGRAVSIRGVVTDAENQPVGGAKVLLGRFSFSDSRETKSESDGTFMIVGAKPGKDLLSAEAEGFSTTTIEVEVTTNSAPFTLKLQRGNILRLRVVNQAGQPVPKAYVWLNTFDRRANDGNTSSPAPVQASFDLKTDTDGRLVWSNAPSGRLTFDVQGSGYMRVDGVKVQADGEEHVIKLPPALVVSGTVRDAATGNFVPRFRMGAGWPEMNADGTTAAQWSTIDRFWVSFAGGKFRHSYEEAVVGGTDNRGYVLKFEAEDYSPFISRVIRADEGEVTLDVKLKVASETTVKVFQPDGSPAVDADVGFVSPGAPLRLKPGGFTRENLQSSGSLRRTDGEGKFQLPPDEGINRVIVASPTGYAEVARVVLAKNPTVQLLPWGRIEGTYLSGNQPVTGREFLLQYETGTPGNNDISFDFMSFKVSTDKEGHFTFPQAPPGKFKLVRLVPQKFGDGSGGWSHDPIQDVEVRPGETTTVTVGGSGYTVTARLRWPGDLNPDKGWRIFGSINTPLPPSLTELMKQAASRTNLQQLPEFQEFSRNARHFSLAIGGDGILNAENVLPGEYVLNVMATLVQNAEGKQTVSANGGIKLSVPAEPASGTLDAGEVWLKKTEMPR